MSARTEATLIGFRAILMWASLGTLVAVSGRLPTFEMNALTFGISGLVGCVALALTGRLRALTPAIGFAAVAVTLGALIASKDVFIRPNPPGEPPSEPRPT